MVASRSGGLWQGLLVLTLVAVGILVLAGRLPGLSNNEVEKEDLRELLKDNIRHLQETGENENDHRHINKYWPQDLQPYEENVVPNIVHYIWLGQRPFLFHHLVSIASAKRFLKPDKIMFHTDANVMIDFDNMDFREGVECGRLWKQARGIPGFEVVRFQPTAGLNNLTVDPQTQHFLSRIQILKKYGGIYLDDDVVVINSFDPLMKYDFVIGRERSGLNTGILLAKAKGEVTFLDKWLKFFDKYGSDDQFSPEKCLYRLVSQNPDLVHVEKTKFRRLDIFQNDAQTDNIFSGRVSHYKNYAIKLYYDLYFLEYSEQKIKYTNSTYGDLARMAYYGSPAPKIDWPPAEVKLPRVPNVVHYIWFSPHEFQFHHFLSIKSALHIQRADKVMFHTDSIPEGEWWDKAKKMAGTKMNVTFLKQPTDAFGRELPKVHHRSHVARLQLLLDHGGIFVEEDTLIVKSLDTIRHYPFTMGMDVYGLNNGVMLSEPGAEFLRFYLESYHFFNDAEEHFSSSMEPYRLGNDHPDSLNVEELRLTRPDWTDWFDMGRLWREDSKRDWSHMLCIQLKWIYHGKTYRPEDILQMDTTFGEIARLVYFGSPALIHDSIDIDTFEKGFYREEGHKHKLDSTNLKNKQKSPHEEMAQRKDDFYIREVKHPKDQPAEKPVRIDEVVLKDDDDDDDRRDKIDQ
ncbi:uncharacterized protein LOC144438694 [Glandiceps talaboti]